MKTTQFQRPFWTALFALFVFAAGVNAQLIIPDISIDVQRLPQESLVKEKVEDLDTTLVLYFGDRMQEWNRDLEQYDLPVQINIYFTDYFPNPNGDRYKAQLVITNKAEARFDDKRWEFVLNPPFQFQPTEFDPLTSVIEFYIWILIGIEEDKFEKFGGNRYFDQAKQITTEYSRSEFIEGWDRRRELLLDYIGEDNKIFRELNFYYYTGIYYDGERDYENSEIYLRYALIKLERTSPDTRRQFLESNHLDFAQAIANAATGGEEPALTRAEEGIQTLIRIDPARRDTYESYMPVREEEEKDE